MRVLPLFCLLASVSATAQVADLRPLDPALEGSWEAVELETPEGESGVKIQSLIIEGNRVVNTLVGTRDGEPFEHTMQGECFLVDMPLRRGPMAGTVLEDVIVCPPSEDGSRGDGSLGQYEVNGDTLVLTAPNVGQGMMRAVFRRVE